MKQCPFGIKCEDCRFSSIWRLVSDKGEEKFQDCCGFEVLFAEIPKIRGSIDGCQSATNETRNRVFDYAEAATNAIRSIPSFVEALAIRTIENVPPDTK